MSKEQSFDFELKKLFEVCVKILEDYAKTFYSLHPNQENHVLRNLQRYRIVYNMTEVQTHIPYFQNLFRTNRDELLACSKNDQWLLEHNLVIQFGEELEDEELRRRSEKRKIELSAIYRYAVQLRKSTEESLKGLPDSIHQQAQELIYPEVFLLHLYRVLFTLYSQNKELERNIQNLERDLGMKSEKKQGGNPLLNNFADQAKNILGGVLPTNFKLPSNEEMNQKLEQAFKDPLVSETLGSTVQNLMSAKNLGEGLSVALKSLENPKFMEGLMKTVQTLIPQDTLQTIVQSAEQLKSSPDLKESLGKLGLPQEIDISKALEGGGSITEFAKSLNLSSVLLPPSETNCEDGVCQISESSAPQNKLLIDL
jgi:hypothetical protein